MGSVPILRMITILKNFPIDTSLTTITKKLIGCMQSPKKITPRLGRPISRCQPPKKAVSFRDCKITPSQKQKKRPQNIPKNTTTKQPDLNLHNKDLLSFCSGPLGSVQTFVLALVNVIMWPARKRKKRVGIFVGGFLASLLLLVRIVFGWNLQFWDWKVKREDQ